jgi:hypothetical protein
MREARHPPEARIQCDCECGRLGYGTTTVIEQLEVCEVAEHVRCIHNVVFLFRGSTLRK